MHLSKMTQILKKRGYMEPNSVENLERTYRRTLFDIPNKNQKGIDHGRTRTCNPQIRSLVPYPLGHAASLTRVV